MKDVIESMGMEVEMFESLQKTATGSLQVHLLNYDQQKIASGVEVTVTGSLGNANLYVPDGREKEQTLKGTKLKRGQVRYRLPGFARYALLVVE